MLRRQESRSRKAVGFCLLLAVWLLFSAPGPAATTGPTEVVQSFYGELLDVMQHAAALGAKGRYEKLESAVLGTFDIPFMARLSIGPTWYRLTPEQKRQAAAAYGRYIGAVYANRFDG